LAASFALASTGNCAFGTNCEHAGAATTCALAAIHKAANSFFIEGSRCGKEWRKRDAKYSDVGADGESIFSSAERIVRTPINMKYSAYSIAALRELKEMRHRHRVIEREWCKAAY
jgi:hypothetical protein